jgi:hypothetical protein
LRLKLADGLATMLGLPVVSEVLESLKPSGHRRFERVGVGLALPDGDAYEEVAAFVCDEEAGEAGCGPPLPEVFTLSPLRRLG